jgi:hypothetical protein
MPPYFVLVLALIILSHPSVNAAQLEDEVISKLMEPGITAVALDASIRKARSAGIPAQTILEARLMWGLRCQDTAYLTSLLPDLEGQVTDYHPSDSPNGLDTVEHYRAMISYVRALQASDSRDEEAFRRHITEAIWLYPQQGGVFGSAIDQFQTMKKMAGVTLDLTLPISRSKGKSTTLGDTLGSGKAMLMLFWSKGEPKSLQAITPFAKKGPVLAPFGIRLVGMNLDNLATAEAARGEYDITFPWLVESTNHPITRLLDITSLPRAILVSAQGRILFHSHPNDPTLWKALKRVAPTLIPPKM